jgi:uncharacterized RDD family membrane protein YckC
MEKQPNNNYAPPKSAVADPADSDDTVIKDVRTDGSRASFGRIFGLRYLVNTRLTMVLRLGGLYGLVDVLMIFGSAKRCCHDYIADTIVVRA